MYLKRLEIKGFKSFADSTEINLRPGINIIVGPNGCGKSNVVDAIRWVLGEANIRHLRGHKSEDVIFNGTDVKKALGMAQVEIELDNRDQLLPLDYSEITLNRKVFRSGESEFYINKSRVRMKDVSDLFIGTGLGKKGYSIISQGELEQVLNGQALDRRLILEEASGIIKYRQQRDEVKRRLENTGNDLLRLGDIITEVRERREELSHKADKARLYLQLQQECQQLEKRTLTAEILKTSQELQRKREGLLQYQNESSLLQQNLSGQEQQLEQEEQKLQVLQQQLNSKQNQVYQTQNELSSLQGELKLCAERMKNRQDRLEQCRADEIKYNDMLTRLNQDLTLKHQDYHLQEADYRQRVGDCERLEQEIAELEQQLHKDRDLFAQGKTQVFEQMQEESRLKNQISEREEQLKKLGERKERLLIRLDEYKNKIQQYNRDYEALQSQISSFKTSLADNDRQLAEMEQHRVELEAGYRKVEADYAQLNQEGIKINNSLQALKEMTRNLSGYSSAVKSLMKAGRAGTLQGIMGIPGEFIDVPPGMEMALEIGVGRGLENIVTDTVEHARQAIEFLKTHKLGRVTFLPLDVLKTQPVPEKILQQLEGRQRVVGLASRVVGFDSRYRVAIEYLLGRVLIVEDMNTAIHIFKNINYPLRLVSLEGDLVNVSGAVSGGAKPSSHGNSPLIRRGEEKRWLKQQEENTRAQGDKQKELIALQGELEQSAAAINAVKQKRLECSMAVDIREKQIKEIASSISEGSELIEGFQQETKELEQQIAELQNDMAAMQDQLGGMHGESEKATAHLEEMRGQLDLQQRNLEVCRERLSSQQEQLAMKRRELDNIKNNAVQFEKVQQSYLQSVEEAKQLGEQMAAQNRQEELRVKELQKKIEEEKVKVADLTGKIAQLKKSDDQGSINIRKLRRDLLPGREKLSELERQSRNLELAIARLETELSALNIKWKEKFRDDIELGAEIPDHAEIKAGKLRIEQLQAELEQMGPVDPESIHEYDEIQERFAFLDKQYRDLLQARESLHRLLGETEKLMLKKFSHFLQMANDSFNRTFKEIFAGGDACLRVENGKEHLEAGVEIEVKLPGKRPQLLGLLSGGERALTCIAFIFSLLRLKPAPFCLLDEIDASLDEINLTRFAHFLQGMASSMQFIIITHRQATIEIGENIYGVTMPEKGVSSILTLNLGETESLAG